MPVVASSTCVASTHAIEIWLGFRARARARARVRVRVGVRVGVRVRVRVGVRVRVRVRVRSRATVVHLTIATQVVDHERGAEKVYSNEALGVVVRT